MAEKRRATLADLGRPLDGALWMAEAGLSFVGVNGIVRYLETELPTAQSAFIRFGFRLLMLLPALWAMRGCGFSLVLGGCSWNAGPCMCWR